MIVSKKLIRELVKLICVGRLCDECPIQDECERCMSTEPMLSNATMDEIINLIKEIEKEH